MEQREHAHTKIPTHRNRTVTCSNCMDRMKGGLERERNARVNEFFLSFA